MNNIILKDMIKSLNQEKKEAVIEKQSLIFQKDKLE